VEETFTTRFWERVGGGHLADCNLERNNNKNNLSIVLGVNPIVLVNPRCLPPTGHRVNPKNTIDIYAAEEAFATRFWQRVGWRHLADRNLKDNEQNGNHYKEKGAGEIDIHPVEEAMRSIYILWKRRSRRDSGSASVGEILRMAT